MTRLLLDDFSHNQPYGQVIGSTTRDGHRRSGQDRERVIAIDNGALRISPLMQPGWNRAGIAYQAYPIKNGLVLSALILNGHNTSQADSLEQSFVQRLARWLRGHHLDHTKMLSRGLQWVLHGDKRAHWRRLRWWWYLNHHELPELYENLAVGWFSTPMPDDPRDEASAMFMRATGAENGELCIQMGNGIVPVIRGVHNIPIYYAIVLREAGAAYYVASLPSAHGMAAFPEFRPVGIDTRMHSPSLHPAIYQSVMGQIGFRAETRVHRVQIDAVDSLENWYGTAHTADRLSGSGKLANSSAEIGGTWCVPCGEFTRTERGGVASEPGSTALIVPDTQSGLIRLQFELSHPQSCDLILLWRKQTQANWQIHLTASGCSLQRQHADCVHDVVYYEAPPLQPAATNDIQILDDGDEMRVILNSQLLFTHQDTHLAQATGIGFQLKQGDATVALTTIEAHPRAVRLPISFDHSLSPPKKTQRMCIYDDFSGDREDLHGRRIPNSTLIWKRQVGSGTFMVDGNGRLQVDASADYPNPGRTAYVIDWHNPTFAELEADILPPGTGYGQGAAGRAGFIIMESPQRYVIVNTWLDDFYEGTSISSFFQLDGFEELYDAVWTNIGRRITWGNAYRLRMTFDGMRYCIYVDDVPVLYRALTDVYPHARPLSIHYVGLVANWEWGNDTGSIFQNFKVMI